MRYLHVMTDYFAYPIWERTPGASVGSIDPASLPISKDLQEQLLRWAEEYDAADVDVPMPARWSRTGAELAARMQEELGVEYRVSYQS